MTRSYISNRLGRMYAIACVYLFFGSPRFFFFGLFFLCMRLSMVFNCTKCTRVVLSTYECALQTAHLFPFRACCLFLQATYDRCDVVLLLRNGTTFGLFSAWCWRRGRMLHGRVWVARCGLCCACRQRHGVRMRVRLEFGCA